MCTFLDKFPVFIANRLFGDGKVEENINNVENDEIPANLIEILDNTNNSELLESTVDITDNEETDLNNMMLTVIGEWKKEKEETRKDKKAIRDFFKWTLIAQLIFMADVIILNAFGWFGFRIEQWTLSLLVTGVFAETITVFTVVVKNIFPEDENKSMQELVKEIYNINKKK